MGRQDDNRKEVPSLKDACLEFISRNLFTYNEAFCSTEDADLKGNLEYLRRFHTSYLIEKNFDQNGGMEPMDESYFKFLINEYLKELNLVFFKESDWDALLRRTAEVGHVFKKVEFPTWDDLESFLEEFEERMNFVHEVIVNIPNVESLDLGAYCYDTTLEVIASSCPKLKELTIFYGFCTSEGLPSLGALSLRTPTDLNVGVEFLLRNMPSLETIEYTNLADVLYRMHKDDENILQTEYNLISLDMNCISSDHTADALAVLTVVCPRLRRLILRNANKECLDLIERFSELQDLDIKGQALLRADCSSFLQCRGGGLRKLEMYDLQISADALVQSCPKIEILLLRGMTFKPLGHRSVLTPLYRLRELSFWRLNFKETLTQKSVTAILKSSVNLRKLTFHDCKFENPVRIVRDLMKSCGSSSLDWLLFDSCGFGEATVKTALSTLINIENIRLVVYDFFCDREAIERAFEEATLLFA